MLQAPPLRICILGPHGAGKTICARWLAEKLGIFHIQFEERLQELIMIKTGHRVGPDEDEEDEEESSTAMQEMAEYRFGSATEFESEEDNRRIQDVILLQYLNIVVIKVMVWSPLWGLLLHFTGPQGSQKAGCCHIQIWHWVPPSSNGALKVKYILSWE